MLLLSVPRNYYSTLNATTHAFLERWFQFRHQAGDTLWGKLAVAVGVGGTAGQAPADEMEKFFLYNFVETVAKVTGQGAASCFSCGYGETCQVGIPVLLHGQGVKITDAMIPDVTKQTEVMASAAEAGELLGQRLRNGHDRAAVTSRMQKQLMAKFGGDRLTSSEEAQPGFYPPVRLNISFFTMECIIPYC